MLENPDVRDANQRMKQAELALTTCCARRWSELTLPLQPSWIRCLRRNTIGVASSSLVAVFSVSRLQILAFQSR